MTPGCLVPTCTRPVRRQGWCGYHAPPITESREELATIRDVDKRLQEITGTLRIITASRLLESGRASSWPEAVRKARTTP